MNDERLSLNDLVPVFATTDPGLLPLAVLALEAEGIEHIVRQRDRGDSFKWMMTQSPTNAPTNVEIRVAADVADRAREILADLQPPAVTTTPAPAALTESADASAIYIESAPAGTAIGTITEPQLQELSTHLAEVEPQEYLIDAAAIDTLRDAGCDAALIELLDGALAHAGTGGLAIRWAVR